VTRLRRAALEIFGRLPAPLRRLAVRLITPHYVMGAVLALRKGDEVLMLRSRHVRFGWTLPGGLMQGGETPREALHRELLEELRIEVDLDEEASVVIVDPVDRRVDFVFERHVSERPVVHVDGTEVLEARWLPLTSELCDDVARDALTRLASR
jgi:8-oxo-dGTP pyrophosphatase MutT (NUDIX family)